VTVIVARCLVEGEAEGALALWSAPLSFWGGFDAASGRVVDRTHPAFGDCVSGRVLAMPSGRGSSSASSVLAEAIRRGTAPAAIILARGDPILVVGAIVARRLYGRACPIVVCAAQDFAKLADGRRARVVAHGDWCAIHAQDDQAGLVSRTRSGGAAPAGEV
jgi:predicted aconitase with swiveling domain